MARDTITGSRIRERRIISDMRQSDLARTVGISASYLNLIEHNRRRIGGKLLVDIAQALDVEPSLLSEGAEAALIATLREAAVDRAAAKPELDRVDEFAGRFPGWAQLIADTHRRIASLEHTAATLTDRLNHDPHLATSIHEVLSMVTAIRSTAGILADTHEIEPEWRNRFHRNLNEDSKRLAESSQLLVSYLDGAGDVDASPTLPQEEVEAMLGGMGYDLSILEDPEFVAEAFLAGRPELGSFGSRTMAAQVLRRLRADVLAMPGKKFLKAMADHHGDPLKLAGEMGVGLAAVFRRMAILPASALARPVGLVMCDASGMLLVRRPLDGFPVPRFSAACPKWPLFQSLTNPTRPIRQVVEVTGRDALRFECFAVAEPVGGLEFNVDPLYHAYMLVMPVEGRDDHARQVGSTCRVCPSEACDGRREPSILVDGV